MAIAAKISTPSTPERGQFSRPSFNKSKQLWEQMIGYRMNRETKQRTRRPFSFGKVEIWAIAESVKQQSEFMSVEANWSETGPMLQRFLPEYDWSKPVWLEGWMETALREKDKNLDEKKSRKEKLLADLTNECEVEQGKVADKLVERSTGFDPAAIQRYLAAQGLIAVPTDSMAGKKAAPRLAISTYEAIQRYAKAQAARVGAKSDPIDAGTAEGKVKELVLAMGLSSASLQKEEKDQPFSGILKVEPVIRLTKSEGFDFDITRSIYDLSDDETAMLIVGYWKSIPDGVGKRTAKNRIAAFREFMNWCKSGKNISGFIAPTCLGAEATIRAKRKSKAIKYTATMVSTLFNADTERFKLFALIGMNTGMYQSDISNMTESTIITYKGRKCLWWKRSKEDLADKDQGNDFHILSPLWPETIRMIEKFRAKPNKYGRLFLSRNGTPLKARKSDAVAKAQNAAWAKYLLTVTETPEKKLTFKQWRKVSWNIIQRKFDVTTAKIFSGQRVEGIGFDYDDASPDSYNMLFPVMRKVRIKLIRDGVFADITGKIQPRSADGR